MKSIKYYPITKRILVGIIFLSLIFTFTQVQPARAWTIIEVDEDISANTTWSPGTDNVYLVVADVTVLTGVTLTIEPGTIIKFQNDCELLIDGKLVAVGTPTEKIYFTYWADDSVGGDTNNDGSATTPDPNNRDSIWGRIRFGSASDDTSIIEYAVIRYAGNICNYYGCNTDVAAVEIVDASPTIQNNQISQNRLYGISMETTLPEEPSQPSISSNTISNNLTFALSSDVHSQPQLSDNTLTGNIGNGMEIQGGTIQTDVSWDQTSVVYVPSEDVTVSSGSQLTISPDSIIKFQNDCELLMDGKLEAVGTLTEKIYFTYWADDAVGGDTNGDGTDTTPDPNNRDRIWGRIRFGSASDDTSIIEYAVIRYAGNICNWYGCNTDVAAVEIMDASPTIQNNQISQNRLYGISVETTIPEQPSEPAFVCLDIEENLEYGLYNKTASSTVSATNLWWGSTTGPYHPTLNSGGLGNEVSDGVTFIPWATTRCISSGADDYWFYLPLVSR